MRTPKPVQETPQEFKDRYAQIKKPDKDYCMIFQQPPIGSSVFNAADGTWSHRRLLTDGTWTCIKKNCARVHEEAPASQADAVMEIRRYMDDLAQYHRDEKTRKKEAQAGQR